MPLAQIEAYKTQMGWAVPFVSSRGTSFADDCGASGGFVLSVFLRDGEDVYRTYNTTSRGVDRILGSTTSWTSRRTDDRRPGRTRRLAGRSRTTSGFDGLALDRSRGGDRGVRGHRGGAFIRRLDLMRCFARSPPRAGAGSVARVNDLVHLLMSVEMVVMAWHGPARGWWSLQLTVFTVGTGWFLVQAVAPLPVGSVMTARPTRPICGAAPRRTAGHAGAWPPEVRAAQHAIITAVMTWMIAVMPAGGARTAVVRACGCPGWRCRLLPGLAAWTGSRCALRRLPRAERVIWLLTASADAGMSDVSRYG